jgi:hypothetical protein
MAAGGMARTGLRRRSVRGLGTIPLGPLFSHRCREERADLALPLLVASLGAIVTSTALGSEPIYDTLRTRMLAKDSLK